MLCRVKHTIEGWGWVLHCVSLTLQGNRWAHDPFTGRAMLMRSLLRVPEVPSATWALPSSLTILSLCSGPGLSLPPTHQLRFCPRSSPCHFLCLRSPVPCFLQTIQLIPFPPFPVPLCHFSSCTNNGQRLLDPSVPLLSFSTRRLKVS